jgi:FKBP-type peptidyl-prolyl cis-trans isomerase SlyD
MQISPGKVVLIDYTLSDDDKKTIDSSEGGEPLAYIHGSGQIIPGLEKALTGKVVGDALTVDVTPEEGYGLQDPAKIIVIPRSKIDGVPDLKVGMQLQASGGQGAQVVTISKIEGDEVTLDANHPLAGENLHFVVTIREVRNATEEELSHGHVHGPGGHHHH